MSAEKIEPDVLQIEHKPENHGHSSFDTEDIKGNDFTVSAGELPKGYFTSFRFIGSYLAIAMMMACGQGGFSLIAGILPQINADLGPSSNISWVAMVYLLTTSIGLVIVGRVTDIFGRRWWFTGAGVVGTIGSIICSVAPTMAALIAGQTLIGIAASVQLSYAFVMTELVPIKLRFVATAFVFAWLIPFSGFGPALGYSFIYNTKASWRGIYYMMIGMNATSTILFYAFYHPPSFAMKHDPSRKWEYIKNFDYLGTVIFILGFLLMLMGLSWGGTLYPWKSAHVIATMVIGGILLVVFFAYENFAKLKEPILPMHILSNKGWMITSLLWGTGSALYYANAILWPSMVAVLYAPGHGWMRNGFLASVPGSAIILGEFTSACFRRSTHIQLRVLFPCVAIVLACMATSTPDSMPRSTGLIFVASYLIGWCEMIQSNIISITLEDQREIGTGVGASGGMRSFFSTIGSTIFTAVLNNRLGHFVPTQVPAALIAAGVPSGSVAALITAVGTNPGGDFTTVPGVTAAMASTALRAYQEAASKSYNVVWLSTLSLSIISCILTIWAPNCNARLTDDVNVPIHERKSDKPLPIGTKQHATTEVEQV